MKKTVLLIFEGFAGAKNSLICMVLSLMSMLESLVLKNLTQCTSQRVKKNIWSPSYDLFVIDPSIARSIARSLDRSLDRSLARSLARSIARLIGGGIFRPKTSVWNMLRGVEYSTGDACISGDAYGWVDSNTLVIPK